ncbi:hypothetical protein V8E36_003979 [Tilletia maclaganii]
MAAAATALSAEHKVPTLWTKANPRTKDELDVLLASVAIREQDDWRSNVLVPEAMAKWKTDVKAHSKQPFSDSMLQYLEDELKYEATRWHDEARGIESTGALGVVRSDRSIDASVLERLRSISNELEGGPEKDWHPETDNTLLDVVHPSLYPLVDDHTRILEAENAISFPKGSRDLGRWFTEVGKVHEGKEENQTDTGAQGFDKVSHAHQWLPAEFEVDESGKVKALSYINNLHPDPSKPAGQLYDVIKSVLESFVPLFEASLSEYQLRGFRKEFRKNNENPTWLDESWDPPAPEETPIEVLATTEDDKNYLTTDGDANWDTSAARIDRVRAEYWSEHRKWIRIPIEKFEPQDIKPISLKSRRLQIVVKLDTVHLDSSKPAYEGDEWHVQGTHREKFCAAGIVYFDQDNTEGSTISLRSALDPALAQGMVSATQQDYDGVSEFYGFGPDAETTQQVGTFHTKTGRSLAFVNNLHLQISPCKLADPSKPGFLKTLSFYLVNPLERVISTAQVPPQQYDWMQGYYSELINSLPPKVPNEIRDMIVQLAAPASIVPLPVEREQTESKRKRVRLASDSKKLCGMSLQEAQNYRIMLVRERAAQAVFIEEQNEMGFAFREQ